MEDSISFWSLGVAIVSLGVSIFVAFFSFRQSQKLNIVNLRKTYFSEIFDTYLIYKIPNTRLYIRFSDTQADDLKFFQLQDYNPLCNTLTEMLTSAMYFKYSDKHFYQLFSDKIMEVEDYIYTISNRKLTDLEMIAAEKKINKLLEEFYRLIEKNYFGK